MRDRLRQFCLTNLSIIGLVIGAVAVSVGLWAMILAVL